MQNSPVEKRAGVWIVDVKLKWNSKLEEVNMTKLLLLPSLHHNGEALRYRAECQKYSWEICHTNRIVTRSIGEEITLSLRNREKMRQDYKFTLPTGEKELNQKSF